MAKKKETNKALIRRQELLKRIKALEKFIDPKLLESAVSEDEKAFIIAQANKKWRNSKDKLQISMVKTSSTIDGRLKQLRSELAKVEKHLGTRYLTKGSRVPTDHTWQYKAEPGTNKMVNPDYVRSYDPEVKALAPPEPEKVYMKDSSGQRTEVPPNSIYYDKALKLQQKGKVFTLTNKEKITTEQETGLSATNVKKGQGGLKLGSTTQRNNQTDNSTDDVSPYKQPGISKKAPKQVGKLSINPGGLVGRYDDVRRSDGRSTALSIAQEDFMGVKKGEMLGVLTRSQRNLYDREVLKIGG